MLREFRLPDVGEGLTEAEIVRWHVTPGDSVKINQTIVEIETAKAVVELPCPYEGTVSALMADEGQTVDVGSPIISVRTGDGEGPADAGREALAGDLVPDVADGAEPKKEKRRPVLVGYGVKTSATRRRPRKPTSSAPVPATPTPATPSAATPSASPSVPANGHAASARVRVLAKPPVRKLARDLGVDLTALTGSGPQGSITRADVEAAMAAPVPATSVTTGARGRSTSPSEGSGRRPRRPWWPARSRLRT